MTPADIVRSALDAGLDAIAIADHNDTSWIDPVRQAALRTPLRVFPAVEVTARGGHLLAIFDLATPVQPMNEFLVKVGIDTAMRGRDDAIGEEFETVLEQATKQGAITVAAHVDSTNGFMETMTQGQHRIRTYRHPHLTALEVVKDKSISLFRDGRIPDYSQKRACLQSSDAHRLSDIGSRFTFVKMDLISLEGIRQALLDHTIRLAYASDAPQPTYPRITALSVDQGFFEGQTFRFHPNLNCLTGGKGTGKSTVVEFIRYVFDCLSPIPDFEFDAIGKIESLVGPGGWISVLCEDEYGREYTLARGADPAEPPRITDNATGTQTSTPFKPVCFS